MNENPSNDTPGKKQETPPDADEAQGSRLPIIPIVAGIAALVAAVLVIVLVGGSDDESDGGGNVGDEQFPPHFVDEADLAAYEEGSPERALLEWWQAFQFADATAVEILTSEETLDEVGRNDLGELVRVQGKGLQGIEVLGVTEAGDVASVRAGLLTFQPENPGDPPPDEPTGSVPTTFRMVMEDGEWLFDEPAYLLPKIESLKASQKQAEEGKDEGEKSAE